MLNFSYSEVRLLLPWLLAKQTGSYLQKMAGRLMQLLIGKDDRLSKPTK